MEQCNKCNVDGVLHTSLRGRYMWRCPDCYGTWRTAGSQLEFWNIMKGPVNFDIPAGVVVVEKN